MLFLNVITTHFMLVDAVIEFHLYGYSSIGNRLCCGMVITIVFMLIDAMFEYLFEYMSTCNEFHCVIGIATDLT